MPRAIWSGSISFGLVNVPVKMYSAIREQDLSFHQFQEGTVLEYIERKAEGEEVVVEERAAEEPKVVDLMAALEASLAAAQKNGSKKSSSGRRKAGSGRKSA